MIAPTQRLPVPRGRTFHRYCSLRHSFCEDRGIGSAGLKDYNLNVGRASFWKSVSRTLTTRHPEVRKRASVFFSLQVGPKDLVLEFLSLGKLESSAGGAGHSWLDSAYGFYKTRLRRIFSRSATASESFLMTYSLRLELKDRSSASW